MENRKTIGVLASFTSETQRSEYFAEILGGIVDAVRPLPYNLKLIFLRDEEYADPGFDLIKENPVDGLLLLTWRIHPKYVQEQFTPGMPPVVVINDYAPDQKMNIVYCNNQAGMMLGMKHLFSRGYRKIGMIQAPDEDGLDAGIRFQAYRELLKENDIPFDPAHFRKCEYYFEEDGYLKVMDMIRSGKSMPRALVCFNDDIAIGALKALKESWIKCPEDIAVIGYDGIERGKHVLPPLTTVRQPLERMGREMVQMIVGLIEGKRTFPSEKEFFPELVIRQST